MKLEVGKTYMSRERYVTICHKIEQVSHTQGHTYLGFISTKEGSMTTEGVGAYDAEGRFHGLNNRLMREDLKPLHLGDKDTISRVAALEKELTTLKQKLKGMGE